MFYLRMAIPIRHVVCPAISKSQSNIKWLRPFSAAGIHFTGYMGLNTDLYSPEACSEVQTGPSDEGQFGKVTLRIKID